MRELASVFKLRIGVFCALAALAGAAAGGGYSPAVAWVALAVLLAAASAGAFNHYWERDLDQLMARTRRRPFATGRFAAGPLWPAALAALLVSAVALAALAADTLAATFVFLGAFFYGGVYTVWLKRRTVWNIVIGGLAGSFAVLAGAAAADPRLSPEALALALVLFLWTPPHFWSLAGALKDDYRAAGVPMLPVLVGEARASRIILANTLMLVSASALPAFYGAGPLYTAAAAGSGAWFLYRSVQLARNPGREASMANFRASLIQLIAILAAIMVEAVI